MDIDSESNCHSTSKCSEDENLNMQDKMKKNA